MQVKLSTGMDFIVDGKLVAPGTKETPIYFSSIYDDTLCGVGAAGEPICDSHNDGDTIAPLLGDWGSVRFGEDSDDTSEISRAVIRYSGKDSGGTINDGAIVLDNASPQLSYITFTDNYINGVELTPTGGDWFTDHWDNPTMIYVIEDRDFAVTAASTLTIDPAMQIKLNTGIDFIAGGKLVAVGTEEEPLYFSSVHDDTLCGIGAADESICDTYNDGDTFAPMVGDWGSVRFSPGSSDTSEISRAIIRYSGKDSGGTINDGAIMLNNASPQLSYITFTDNYINGVEIDIQNGNWNTDKWDNAAMIYVIENSDLTIPAANTLTIEPGMQVKLNSDVDIIVDGKLVASGTEEAPITFSSVYDDTLCGVGAAGEPICDTYNDEDTIELMIADWGAIWFSQESIDTSMISRAVIRYSGKSSGGTVDDGAVKLVSASPTLAFNLFELNYGGIEALEESKPKLTCNDFQDNMAYGIYNDTPQVVINAENHWWDSLTGPTHASNPGGTGQPVSDGVDYSPWAKQSCFNPPPPGSTYYIYLPIIFKN